MVALMGMPAVVGASLGAFIDNAYFMAAWLTFRMRKTLLQASP